MKQKKDCKIVVYVTEREKKAIDTVAEQQIKTSSALVRELILELLDENNEVLLKVQYREVCRGVR